MKKIIAIMLMLSISTGMLTGCKVTGSKITEENSDETVENVTITNETSKEKTKESIENKDTENKNDDDNKGNKTPQEIKENSYKIVRDEVKINKNSKYYSDYLKSNLLLEKQSSGDWQLGQKEYTSDARTVDNIYSAENFNDLVKEGKTGLVRFSFLEKNKRNIKDEIGKRDEYNNESYDFYKYNIDVKRIYTNTTKSSYVFSNIIGSRFDVKNLLLPGEYSLSKNIEYIMMLKISEDNLVYPKDSYYMTSILPVVIIDHDKKTITTYSTFFNDCKNFTEMENKILGLNK